MTWHQTRISNAWVQASYLLFTVLFFIYYPPIFSIRDENIYLSMVSLLRQGTLYAENAGIPLMSAVPALGHLVPVYPPGNAFLLLPFSLIGWPAVFLCGFFIHLICTWLFSRMAEFFDADTPLAVLLYFLFPPFLLYSRTVMSDLPSLAVFLAACVCYYNPKGSKAAAGVWLGLSLFFRTVNAILLLPFGIALLIQGFRENKFKPLLSFCAGALIPVSAALFYNAWLYGNPFLSGYSPVFTGMKWFDVKYAAENLAHYGISLNLAYPLMLVVFLLNKRIRRFEMILLLALLMALFSVYYFHDNFPGRAATWVFGNRFLFTLMPFLILSYGDFLDRIMGKMPFALSRVMTAVLIFLLWGSMFFIFSRHQQTLKEQEVLKNMVYESTGVDDVILYDWRAAELFQAQWGRRLYMPEDRIDLQAIGNAAARGHGIYWVEWTDRGAQPLIAWDNSELNPYRDSFEFKKIAERGEVRVYQISPAPEREKT